jgi:hypothetical protein
MSIGNFTGKKLVLKLTLILGYKHLDYDAIMELYFGIKLLH